LISKGFLDLLDLFGNEKICYNFIGDRNENDRASG